MVQQTEQFAFIYWHFKKRIEFNRNECKLSSVLNTDEQYTVLSQ